MIKNIHNFIINLGIQAKNGKTIEAHPKYNQGEMSSSLVWNNMEKYEKCPKTGFVQISFLLRFAVKRQGKAF